MKQDERSIVRKRTQQLVYLELGRNNGGVMLNLSEDGCGFQAISPVERGTTRFAFQISGGRRIAGEGEVEWTDEVGITGGLRFLDLSAEARKQIRMWLEDTNAPEEPGEGVERTVASVAQVSSRHSNGAEASAESTSHRESRLYSSFGGTRVLEAEAPAPGWMSVPIDNLPTLENERARFPLLRGDGDASAHARSVAFWRGVAGLVAAGAIAALVATHQSDVGSSLIWLGETLSGKTKASAVVPADKPAATTNPATDANTASAATKAPAEATPKNDSGLEQKEDSKTPEATRSEEQTPTRADAAMKSTDRGVSLLEQQPVKQNVDTRYEGETVQSLWDAVQAGSVSAEVSLAERFARGDGVVRNCDQAKVLLRAAANKGNRDARLKLYVLESGGCRQ